MPIFGVIMDAVLGHPRHQHARRLHHLLRHSRRSRVAHHSSRSRVSGCQHPSPSHGCRFTGRCPAGPPLCWPLPHRSPGCPAAFKSRGYSFIRTMDGPRSPTSCAPSRWRSMESPPAPLVVTLPPPTAPPPPSPLATQQPTRRDRSPTPAPPGFGRTGILAACSGEQPLFTYVNTGISFGVCR